MEGELGRCHCVALGMLHKLTAWTVYVLPQYLRRAKSAKPLRVSRLPLSPFGLEPLLTAQRTGGTSELASVPQTCQVG